MFEQRQEDVGKGILSIYKKYDRIKINGYIQPQFQVAESKGADATYAGGDFSPNSNNRFMIRKARVRFEYEHFGENNRLHRSNIISPMPVHL